jgi:hypothetical protein
MTDFDKEDFGGAQIIFSAFEHFITSEVFATNSKQKTKEGSRLRLYKSRYAKGELQTGAIVDVLIKYGYKIAINCP